MIPGVCKYCGCTTLTACPGGCAWINDDATVCRGQNPAQDVPRPAARSKPESTIILP